MNDGNNNKEQPIQEASRLQQIFCFLMSVKFAVWDTAAKHLKSAAMADLKLLMAVL